MAGIIKNQKDIDHLLALTHSEPPPSYGLIYNEFVENNIELSFIGNWNFQKIEKINAYPQLLAKVPPQKSKAYVDFLWDLAGGPSRYSGVLPEISRVGQNAIFEQNVEVNLQTLDARISSAQYGHGIPYSIFYLDGNEVMEKKLKEANLNYSLILLNRQDRYNIILLDRRLAQSMLMRLYFFEGKGLKYFEPLIREADLTGRTDIRVFKIDWDKFEQDLSQNR